MSWPNLSDWWRKEVESDPAYEEVVTPLLVEALQPKDGAIYLDLGCGEGRVMRTLVSRGICVVGIDLNEDLATRARALVARIPHLPIRGDSFDSSYSVLALEHIADEVSFFREAARVTRPRGVLVLVMNHPIWTAPESTPITDSDGETLWRPGRYFSRGFSSLPADEDTVVFYHRSISELLNAAADAGWSLELMLERPHHEYADQAGVPRLMACRWVLRGENHD